MWQGEHAWQGGTCGRGHAQQGACVVEGVHGRGGMCGRGVGHAWWGHAWQGACVAGAHVWQGVGHAWWGHAWQGGMHGGGVCVARGMCGSGGLAWQEGMCGRRNGHCSGRYASYWNAFLFGKFFSKNCMEMKKIGLRGGALSHLLDPPLLPIILIK